MTSLLEAVRDRQMCKQLMLTDMKLIKCLVAFSCLLASCSSVDEMKETVSDGEIRNAVVHIAPYSFDECETRTDLIYKDNKLTFNWDDDETIGVFPITPYSGSQAYKHLERSVNDGHVATFDGGGWKIRPEATYVAYYPYNGKLTSETTFEKIPVSLKRQVQDGYNNLDHIGKKYDYMCASATAPSEGDIVFNFKHITSIVQLEITLPEAGVISNVIIFDNQHEQVFVDSALMNVQTREVTPVHKSSMVELEVKNGVEAKANEKVLLYISMLPMDSRPVNITVETIDGKCYGSSYTPKRMKAGYAYHWSISPKYAGEHVAVDLGLPSGTKWATMNVGANAVTKNGRFFAWGETLPLPGSLRYNKDYKWKDANTDKFNKYITYDNSNFGILIDGLTTLLPEDDAATQNWGEKWRMPTKAEMRELLDNCMWNLDFDYLGSSAPGYVVMGKNGNSIFLPLNNIISSEVCYAWGYWSSSLYEEYNVNAYCFYVLGNGNGDWREPKDWAESLCISEGMYRDRLLLVRPVCK